MPDYTASSILDVDFKALRELGVKHILVDLDLTLRKKMTRQIEPQVINYLIKNFKQHNFASISIASNNILDLKRYGSPLSAHIFQPYWLGLRLVRKPNRLFFQRITKILATNPSACVMIGDKLRADVFGGNRAGMYTVLVNPKGKDYLYDRILFTRFRERRSLAELLAKKKR